MNELYAKVAALTDNQKQKAALAASQKAWASYRKSRCDFTYSVWEGGAEPGVHGSLCLISTTQRRIRDLDGDLDDVSPG